MMYYEFESGFGEYFKDTKLSSEEEILSELKATKTKLSILCNSNIILYFNSVSFVNNYLLHKVKSSICVHSWYMYIRVTDYAYNIYDREGISIL